MVPAGPRRYDVKGWFATSLPIIAVWTLLHALTYTDVLVLQQFRPPERSRTTTPRSKTLTLVTFVYFSVAAAVAHRFTAYHVAGDREGLAAFVASTVRWIFWPSLAATLLILALGKPMLWLFGPNFVAAYPVMFMLAIGLLARAAVGPAERLLTMVGQQRICALGLCGRVRASIWRCAWRWRRPYGGIGVAVRDLDRLRGRIGAAVRDRQAPARPAPVRLAAARRLVAAQPLHRPDRCKARSLVGRVPAAPASA